jgi:hypothetical protein
MLFEPIKVAASRWWIGGAIASRRTTARAGPAYRKCRGYPGEVRLGLRLVADNGLNQAGADRKSNSGSRQAVSEELPESCFHNFNAQ